VFSERSQFYEPCEQLNSIDNYKPFMLDAPPKINSFTNSEFVKPKQTREFKS